MKRRKTTSKSSVTTLSESVSRLAELLDQSQPTKTTRTKAKPKPKVSSVKSRVIEPTYPPAGVPNMRPDAPVPGWIHAIPHGATPELREGIEAHNARCLRDSDLYHTIMEMAEGSLVEVSEMEDIASRIREAAYILKQISAA